MTLNKSKHVFIFILFLWYSKVFAFYFPSIEQYLPNNPVILDCGANAGLSSIQLLQYYPDATIIAVEADSDLFALLQQYTKGISQIRTFHCALTSYNGKIPFYENKEKEKSNAQGIYFSSIKRPLVLA